MHRRRTVKAATTPPAIAPADTGTWNWGCSEPGNEKMQELGIKLNPGREVHSCNHSFAEGNLFTVKS